MVERLYAAVSGAADPRPGRGLSWLAAMAFAGMVHLLSLGLFAGSLWLLVVGNFVLRVLGVVGLGVAFVARPRFGRLRPDEWCRRCGWRPSTRAIRLRARLVAERAPREAVIVLGSEEADAIGAELAGVRDRAVREVLSVVR